MKKSLTRNERLKRRSDIKRVFSSASSFSVRGMKLLLVNNDLPRNRFLFTMVRKYGNAVQRNRVRRVQREIVRGLKHEIREGHDMAFIVFPGDYTFSDRSDQVRALIQKAGLHVKIPG